MRFIFSELESKKCDKNNLKNQYEQNNTKFIDNLDVFGNG